MSAVASPPHVDTSPRTLVVAIGDAALILLFIALGELQHGYDLLAQPGRVVGTALPFLIGWGVASVLAGVYTLQIYRSLRRSVVRTALAWVGAVLVGQALRATSIFHGDFAVTFMLVSLGVGLVLLVPWRAAIGYLWRP
ncbi:DUF3054 domain-containing protein [Halococcus sp. AFM35]|uniref:DUF3054 domain-containing protein n=1 Tax=Halococcus sp. AFM35 TaxID=3421653 RepID=UPI003EB970A2